MKHAHRWTCVLLLACAFEACSPGTLPPSDASGELSGDTQEYAPPLPTLRDFRPCTNATTPDSQGGFCDATSLLVANPLRCEGRSGGCLAGGITAADFTGDGRVDLFVGAFGPAGSKLYANNGHGFDDASAASGLGTVLFGRAVLASAAADFDNDGDPDLALSFDRGPVELFTNEAGVFRASTVRIGCDSCQFMTIAPWDFNHDGRLDLALAGYFQGSSNACSIAGFPWPCPDGVHVALQDNTGSFAEVAVTQAPRRVQALRVLDWDGDGQDEILAVTDYGMFDGGSELFTVLRTPQGIALRDDTGVRHFDHALFGMGIAALDLDHTEQSSVLVTNFGRNLLLRPDPARGALEDQARELGLAAYGQWTLDQTLPHYRFFDPENPIEGSFAGFQDTWLNVGSPLFPTTKWTPVVFDFDLDGLEDVFIAAGAVGLGSFFPEPSVQASSLLHQTPSGFEDRTAEEGLFALRNLRGATALDFDHDGDLDLAVLQTSASTNVTGGLRLLRNDHATHDFVHITLRGRSANRDGIGTRFQAQLGTQTLHRVLDGNLSVFATAPHEVWFGLGTQTELTRLEITFPSGTQLLREHLRPGHYVLDENDMP